MEPIDTTKGPFALIPTRVASDLIRFYKSLLVNGLISKEHPAADASQVTGIQSDPIHFRNDTLEEIPAFGCMEITATEDTESSEDNVFVVRKPTGTTGPFLFNNQHAVPAGEYGTAQRDRLVRAVSDGSTVTAGDRWQAKSGYWTIEPNADGPYIMAGSDAIATNGCKIFIDPRRCCAGGECCLLEADLPTLTITGMTGSAWSETLHCCWHMEFEPDESSQITEYSDDLIDAQKSLHYELREVWLHPLKPLYYTTVDTLPTEITDPDVCCVDLIDAGTFVADIDYRTRMRFKIVASYGTLEVILSNETYSCLENDGICRPVMTIIQHIHYKIYLETLEYTHTHRVETAVEACFEHEDGGTEITFDQVIGSEDWADGPTNSVLIDEGDVEIRKHKWWDTYPLPASIDFSLGDTPFDLCIHDLCHQLDEGDEEICFSSGVLGITPDFPDYCSQSNTTDPLDYEFGATEENLQPACPETIDVAVYEFPCEDPPSVIIEDIPLNVTCPDIIEVTSSFPSSFLVRVDDSCCKSYTDPCGTVETRCPSFYKMVVDVFERTVSCTDNTATVELCVQSTPLINVS